MKKIGKGQQRDGILGHWVSIFCFYGQSLSSLPHEKWQVGRLFLTCSVPNHLGKWARSSSYTHPTSMDYTHEATQTVSCSLIVRLGDSRDKGEESVGAIPGNPLGCLQDIVV